MLRIVQLDFRNEDTILGGRIPIGLNYHFENAALDAIQSYPGGLQIGGGINLRNAEFWLKKGASHVIVTSWLIPGQELDMARLSALSKAVGSDKLILDLSCRKKGTAPGYGARR